MPPRPRRIPELNPRLVVSIPKACSGRGLSLQDPTGAQETVEDPRTPDPEETIAQGDMLDRLAELLTLIDEREATILKLRYGLDSADGDAMTLKEIGKIVGLTRERVRQIEQDALRKLYGVMGLD